MASKEISAVEEVTCLALENAARVLEASGYVGMLTHDLRACASNISGLNNTAFIFLEMESADVNGFVEAFDEELLNWKFLVESYDSYANKNGHTVMMYLYSPVRRTPSAFTTAINETLKVVNKTAGYKAVELDLFGRTRARNL